jgi:trk system potassium uptake protein TrkA
MKVIVCGAGQVGANIAAYLSQEDNEVTVIDINQQLIAEINDHLNVSGIVGNASHPNVLEQAGADDAEMIIAATHTDEINMVACQVAHSIFHTPKKIARVRQQVYLDPAWSTLFSRDHMPIDLVISPEVEVAQAIMRRLNTAGVFNLNIFGGGKISLASVVCARDCPILNTPLKHLTPLFPNLLIEVVSILRGDEKIIPTDDEVILPGDEVYFVCATDHLKRCLEAFGKKSPSARRAIIIGGGNIGLLLAKQIEEHHPDIDVRLIEKNLQRAHFVSQMLSKTLVLHGDGLSRQIMEEANSESTEVVISVMDNDEANILSSLMAKQYGSERSITLINNTGYVPLIAAMGIDAIVSPRSITVSSILQHVRKGRIIAAHSLRDGYAEVMEIEALETSSIINIPFKDLKRPKNTIIGAILRGDEVLIPKPETVIRPNDRVIVLADHTRVREVEMMFAVRPEYF